MVDGLTVAAMTQPSFSCMKKMHICIQRKREDGEDVAHRNVWQLWQSWRQFTKATRGGQKPLVSSRKPLHC